MNQIGYLLYKDGGLITGEQGQYYDYKILGNGIFISACNSLILAEIQIADCDIRGLKPSGGVSYFQLEHGKIPARLYDLALSVLLADCTKERYVAIVWNDDRYCIVVPGQDGIEARVKYETVENTVLELHSHPDMPANFSMQDNHDEQGLKLYGVVGILPDETTINLRLGVYGYFQVILWQDIFDGSPEGCRDINEETEIVQDRYDGNVRRKGIFSWLRRNWRVRS
jgi:PRTRC genetic system protein A